MSYRICGCLPTPIFATLILLFSLALLGVGIWTTVVISQEQTFSCTVVNVGNIHTDSDGMYMAKVTVSFKNRTAVDHNAVCPHNSLDGCWDGFAVGSVISCRESAFDSHHVRVNTEGNKLDGIVIGMLALIAIFMLLPGCMCSILHVCYLCADRRAKKSGKIGEQYKAYIKYLLCICYKRDQARYIRYEGDGE
jgi:hypothetical protein